VARTQEAEYSDEALKCQLGYVPLSNVNLVTCHSQMSTWLRATFKYQLGYVPLSNVNLVTCHPVNISPYGGEVVDGPRATCACKLTGHVTLEDRSCLTGVIISFRPRLPIRTQEAEFSEEEEEEFATLNAKCSDPNPKPQDSKPEPRNLNHET
jgi:hypothetical protein